MKFVTMVYIDIQSEYFSNLLIKKNEILIIYSTFSIIRLSYDVLSSQNKQIWF